MQNLKKWTHIRKLLGLKLQIALSGTILSLKQNNFNSIYFWQDEYKIYLFFPANERKENSGQSGYLIHIPQFIFIGFYPKIKRIL